jgi:hypothetical protein
MEENKRLARLAEQQRDYETARIHWQIAQQNSEDLARMAQPKKPRGDTAKTAARKALLTDLRDAIKPASQEHFAEALKEQKYRKQLLTHWSKKQIDNEATLLNFIKKNRVSNS